MAVEFYEEQRSPSFSQQSSRGGIIPILISLRVVENERQGQYFLVFIFVSCLCGMVITLFMLFNPEPTLILPPPGTEIIYPPNQPPRLKNV
jgi:hypothetical protein